MAFTSTLSTSDRRTDTLNQHPIWEQVITFTIDAGDGSAKTAQVIDINGILQKITVSSGVADGISGTLTLSLEDNNDDEIFTASGPAEGAVSTFNVNEPLSGLTDVYINPNDDPTGGSWTIVVTLRGI